MKKQIKNKELVNKKKSSSNVGDKFKFVLLFILASLMLLFYPGDSYYFKLFSEKESIFYNKKLFSPQTKTPIPYVVDKSILPETTAQGVFIVDIDSFTPVFEKNIHQRFLPASTAKIITSLVAYDHFNLDDVLTVRQTTEEGQLMGLVRGEKITFENLLYGILVHSGNDAAYVIADNYKGGNKEFIKAMNKKAAEIVMKESRFKNPAGLDEFDQYTTAFDLALAGRKLLQNKVLSKIVSTKSITISDVDFKHFHTLINVNKLLGEIAGVGGLKTGFTKDAGENLITFYKNNQHNFMIVILKSEDRFEDTKKIVDWINTNVSYLKLSDYSD